MPTEAQGQALTEDSNGAVDQAVSATPGATSVIGFAYYQQNKYKLTGFQLDGVDATIGQHDRGDLQAERLRPHVHEGRRRPD